MKLKYWLTALTIGFAFPIQASEFELALSKDSAAIDILNDSNVIGTGGAELSIGALYNEADDILGHIGLLVRGVPAGEQPFSFGLGGRLYFAALDKPDASVGALALGAGGRYLIPGNIPMAVGGDLYYAPGITTFSDADDLLDIKIRFEADVLPSATAFIGYRNVVTSLEDGPNYDIDENVHLGIRILF
jgi:hypothetical protein